MIHLGILGGGQLGQMMALAARSLGMQVSCVDPSPSAPARVAAQHICAGYTSPEALSALARCDVVTFEFENIPDEAAKKLASMVPVFPGPQALAVCQDRRSEKETFVQLGIETSPYRLVESQADLEAAFAELGPLVVKTRRFGYDGKGQAVIKSAADLPQTFESLGSVPCMAEAFINFDRELSVVACRGRDGQAVVYPLTENYHRGGILRRSLAPAQGVSAETQAQAEKAILALLEHFSYVGTFALELFDCQGKLLANECAPRVHNSGHWTMEGALTSQFENHVRAVTGLPLGLTAPLGKVAMVNLIGSVPEARQVLAVPDAHLHDYGKEPRHGRKVGHVTVRAQSWEELAAPLKELERLAQSVEDVP